MINFYPSNASTTFTVYPETASLSYTGSTYSVTLTHDFDNTSGSFDVTKINTPNPLSSRLILQYNSGSGIPSASGQYTFQLYEPGISINPIWGTFNVKFGEANNKWNSSYTSGSTLIDTDRAYVFGTDEPVFTNYNGGSPNRQTTYYG